MSRHFIYTATVSLTVAIIACSSSTTIVQRTGATTCGTASCAAGQYCADSRVSNCTPGCLSDQNCADNQTCSKTGADIGACVNTGGPPPPSNTKYSCCLNDVYFACADKASFDKCAGFDFGACDMACSPADFACHQQCASQAANAKHDPSACNQQPGKCPTSPPPTGGSCNGSGFSTCQIDSDCHSSSKHCTGGKCFFNQAGSKCNIDSDCGDGNHCTSGCCLTNTAGSKCNIDSDCGSGNHCTSGKCYANMFGSPCNIDSDCGSNSSCVNGKCN